MEPIIRKYRTEDRRSVRDLAFDTALMGESGGAYFDDKEVFSDFLTAYFTDYEPGSSFVAEDNGQVVGYIIGARDIKAMNKVFMSRILPLILLKAILRFSLFKPKNAAFVFQAALSFFRGEFSLPDLYKSYPATLHINIKKGYRRGKIGAGLIASYTEYLAKEGIRAVHLVTMSDEAASFFKSQGFSELYHSKRTYLEYVLRRKTPVYIFGKTLSG